MKQQELRCTRWLARTALALAVLSAPVHSAWALIKCVSSDGKVTFQDVLCDMHSTAVPLRKPHGTQKGADDAPPRDTAEAPSRPAGRPRLPASALTASARMP